MTGTRLGQVPGGRLATQATAERPVALASWRGWIYRPFSVPSRAGLMSQPRGVGNRSLPLHRDDWQPGKIIASANGCTESAPAAPALMLASGSIVTVIPPTLRPRKFQVRRPFACHVVIFVRGQYSR